MILSKGHSLNNWYYNFLQAPKGTLSQKRMSKFVLVKF